MQTEHRQPTQTEQNPSSMSHKELKALAKARRPWYMKKRFWLLGVVGIIVIIAAASSGSKKDNSDTAQPGEVTNPTSSETALFPGRVDAQKSDKERNIGQGAELSGYTATVTAAGFKQSMSGFEKDGYVVVDLTILNRDSKAQPYNTYDWKLQTPNGQVIDPGITSGKSLGSGDLVSGGNVSGQIVFEVGAQKGAFYIIYDPDAFSSERGIWKVTV